MCVKSDEEVTDFHQPGPQGFEELPFVFSTPSQFGKVSAHVFFLFFFLCLRTLGGGRLRGGKDQLFKDSDFLFLLLSWELGISDNILM